MDKHTIFINKKEYKVPFYVFLCHLTGEFTNLKDKDSYVYFIALNKNFNNRIYSKTKSFYLTFKSWHVNEFKSGSTETPFYQCLILGALFYRNNTSAISNFRKKANGSEELNLLFINNIINYPIQQFSLSYSKIKNYLGFYYKLCLVSDSNNITLEKLNELIEDLNLGICLKDIEKDLIEHMIILPYKDYYVWSSKYIYTLLKKTPRVIIQTFNLEKTYSKLKIQP